MSWFSDLFNAGTDTSSQVTSVPDWVQPYLANYMQTSQNVANLPYTPYQGQTVAGLNPFTVQGLNAQAQRAVEGSPVMSAGAGELQKTLGGGYLNGNPYLDAIIAKAGKDITGNMTNIDARSGSFGNSGVQDMTARALADSAMNMRYGDYSQERNRMMQGLSMAPTYANQDYIDATALQQAGQGFQQNQQAQLTDQYQRFQEAQQYPYKQLDTLGKGLGLNFGMTTTLQTPGTSPAATGLGTAASLYSLGNTKSPTVICTELHRQGFMSDEVYALDQAYGSMLAANDPEVYAGYIRLATPVVRKMQQSRLFARIVWTLAKPWADEMAHQMGMGKGSIVGKAIMLIGYPLCRFAGNKAEMNQTAGV
jgi:hypothetical protein